MQETKKQIQEQTKAGVMTRSGVIRLFISVYDSNNGKKLITKLYKEIKRLKSSNTTYIKDKWGQQAGRMLSEKEWGMVNKGQWKTTGSRSWREYGWKNIVRYFITPAQQKSRYTQCWRLCGENKANHFHIFWGCPCILPYWQELQKSMEKITLTFEALYLGRENQEITGSGEKYKFRIMLMAAKKSITRKWLKTDAPKMEDSVEVMLNIYRMKKLTFSNRLKTLVPIPSLRQTRARFSINSSTTSPLVSI